MATALRLELKGQTLELNDWDNNGFIVSSLDLGMPPVRPVSDSLPGQDGTDDQTRNFDARTVQLSGAAVPTLAGASRSKALDKLTPYIIPGAGASLVYALDDDMAERQLDFAYITNWTNPVDHPVNMSQLAFQLVCPNPIAYDADIQEVDVPFATGSTAGFTFPFSFPLAFGAGGATEGSAFVTSEGTYYAWPILRIYGPCVDPAIYWFDPITDAPLGVQVVFSGLTIAEGDYVEVDTKAHTALVDGDPSSSVYQFVDFVNTQWGPLQPGTNLLRYLPGSASGGSMVAVRWQDTFLT